jgi:hypothetical protein
LSIKSFEEMLKIFLKRRNDAGEDLSTVVNFERERIKKNCLLFERKVFLVVF